MGRSWRWSTTGGSPTRIVDHLSGSAAAAAQARGSGHDRLLGPRRRPRRAPVTGITPSPPGPRDHRHAHRPAPGRIMGGFSSRGAVRVFWAPGLPLRGGAGKASLPGRALLAPSPCLAPASRSLRPFWAAGRRARGRGHTVARDPRSVQSTACPTVSRHTACWCRPTTPAGQPRPGPGTGDTGRVWTMIVRPSGSPSRRRPGGCSHQRSIGRAGREQAAPKPMPWAPWRRVGCAMRGWRVPHSAMAPVTHRSP